MSEGMFEVIWIAVGVVFFFGMIAQLRLFSVASNVERIADALEAIALQRQGHQLETNGVREYLE